DELFEDAVHAGTVAAARTRVTPHLLLHAAGRRSRRRRLLLHLRHRPVAGPRDAAMAGEAAHARVLALDVLDRRQQFVIDPAGHGHHVARDLLRVLVLVSPVAEHVTVLAAHAQRAAEAAVH